MPLELNAPIESPRLLLRPVAAEDIPDLFGIKGDAAVTAFLPYETWRSEADGIAWLERMRGLQPPGSALQLVMVDRATHRAIGTCLVFRHEAASARAEIGYVLGRSEWGKGLMQEALTALFDHAFGPLGLRRMEAEVNPDNAASDRLLRRLGFTCEGRLRQRWFGKGRLYDTQIYGLLREEWLARRGGPA